MDYGCSSITMYSLISTHCEYNSVLYIVVLLKNVIYYSWLPKVASAWMQKIGRILFTG